MKIYGYSFACFAMLACLLQADPVFIGSSDGTGNGLINSGTSQLFVDGVCSYTAASSVTFVETVSLQGDIEIHAVDDATLVIGSGIADSVVTIKAANATSSLVFNVDEGKTLEVQVLNSVYFKASSSGVFPITFRGRGSTVFRIPSGRTISFSSSDNGTSLYGVRVQVLMDLGLADVTAGVQQLAFRPWSYAGEDPEDDDSVNTQPNKAMWIRFGRCSALRFLSYNATGINPALAGYGTVSFDVSQQGSGRMIVVIERGATINDGRDAGINIWGSLVTGTGTSGAVTRANLRTGVSAHKRAGVKAIVQITDDVAFNACIADPENPTTPEATAWLARGAADRRGLVVINSANSYPALCSNLSRATSLQTSTWASTQSSRGYQPGFILGDNGVIQIRHNLFLDYIGGSGMQAVTPTALGGSGTTSGLVKMRNPSAFIVDEKGIYGTSQDTTWDMSYVGSSVATILLEGTSGCFFHSGVAADTGAVPAMVVLDGDAVGQSVDATIGRGRYDGTFCPILDEAGVQSNAESIWVDRYGNPMTSDINGVRCLDGEVVLDIEGAFTVKSVLGEFGFLPNGYMAFPSIHIDHTGQETEGAEA